MKNDTMSRVSSYFSKTFSNELFLIFLMTFSNVLSAPHTGKEVCLDIMQIAVQQRRERHITKGTPEKWTALGQVFHESSVLTALYLAKLRRIFVHLQGGFSTA
jgi:hypothetical protein